MLPSTFRCFLKITSCAVSSGVIAALWPAFVVNKDLQWEKVCFFFSSAPTLTWKKTLYNLLLKHLNFMRSFSEEEADKFVMKHHKHGGKGGEQKTEGESVLMKNKADGGTEEVRCEPGRAGPCRARAKENGKSAQSVSSTHGVLIIHQYPILVLTLCQSGKQK